MSIDLGPLPEIHPREDVVSKAKLELMTFLLDWRQRNYLTLLEELALMSGVLTHRLDNCIDRERRKLP